MRRRPGDGFPHYPSAAAAVILLGFAAACSGGGPPASRVAIDALPPVAAGDVAEVRARVPASVACAIQFTRPSGRVSTAAGLETKRSDDAGQIAWQFRVSADTRPGIGTVEVRCGSDSATAPIEITPATSTATAATGPGLPPLTIEVTGNAIGAAAHAVARTTPGTQCMIVALAPSGAKMAAAGLDPKTADENGEARWEWTIPADTSPKGQGAVTIACGGATASAPFVVS